MPLIAILDDQETNRRIFERLASSIENGVVIRIYGDPSLAIADFERGFVPDLIVTDYKMPVMDGEAFIRALRTLPGFSEIPVMVITVYEERSFRMRALEAGATDFLQSPVDHQEFVVRARNLLKLRKQQLLLESRAHTLAEELATSEQSREAALRDSSERLAQVIDTVPAIVSASDSNGRILFANAFAGQFLGLDPAELVGKSSDVLVDADLAGPNRTLDRKVMRGGEALKSFERTLTNASGEKRVFLTTKTPLKDADDVIVGVLTSALDITDRKRAEEHLLHAARHDGLTNLPNRTFLHDRLRREVARARRGDRAFALHFIDIDEFKSINDLMGQEAGDAFLQEIALRLQALAGAEDMVARLGADEFALLQALGPNKTTASDMAQRILDAIGFPVRLSEREAACSASVGVTFYPTDGTEVTQLLRNADLAVQQAKDSGGNQFRLYETNMADRIRNNAVLDSRLRTAIEQKQFVLYYQPQISAKTGAVIGAEALLRWNEPGRGLVSPGEFLLRAEENGLIVPINEWVIHEACREAKSWHRLGLGHLRIGINLSPVQFRRVNVAALVLKALDATGLDPKCLDLEITENIVMEKTESVISVLRQLSDLGVGISIDDFGTGYSSLNYIKQFPIDRIKIDQTFVRNMVTDPSDHTIVRTVAHLGHSLGLTVVAEGVETEAQAKLLMADGCDVMQGYLYGRPMPAQDLIALVRSGPVLEKSA
ncbi:two-component system response regulator [Rhizobium sp. SL86]|uniref:two-component system response regulator n=1 Tax=Rhizobium sp. SL86 TaxID=2995148 RepID=UPI0022756CF9|nr:EAL domain-containing protein [Rhizobium sp. SL86]MCY1665452.1 EAL domain-containing protein [Rhizobium sp. SL86]